jgi:hypothetical protein
MPDFERMVGTEISWLPKLKIKIIKTYKMQKIRFVLFINDFENKFGQALYTNLENIVNLTFFSNVSSLRCT